MLIIFPDWEKYNFPPGVSVTSSVYKVILIKLTHSLDLNLIIIFDFKMYIFKYGNFSTHLILIASN